MIIQKKFKKLLQLSSNSIPMDLVTSGATIPMYKSVNAGC